MSKRIDQLSALSDNDVFQDSRLFAIGDPSTGQLFKGTMAQLKKALSIQKFFVKIPSGDANTTYAPIELTGATVIAIIREGSLVYEVDSSPDSEEYTWDGNVFTFGRSLYPNERVLFLYLNNPIL